MPATQPARQQKGPTVTTVATTATKPTNDQGRLGVLCAVAVGVRHPADIAAYTGLDEVVVHAHLTVLTERGLLQRTALTRRHTLTGTGAEHLIARTTHQPDAAPATVLDDLSDADTRTLWAHRIAQPGGPLTRSALGDLQARPGAEEYELRLDPGRHHLTDALEARRRIAAALGRPAEQVIIEAHPSQVDSAARLILIGEDSPLYQDLTHPGTAAFDHASGELTIGRYADGEPTVWPLWNHRGTLPSTAIGATDAVNALLGVLFAVADNDQVDVHAIDLAGVHGLAAAGQPTAVTRDDAAEVLYETLQLIQERGRWPLNGAAGPQQRRLLVIADLDLLVSEPRFRELVNQVIRRARCHGVGLVSHVTNRLSMMDLGGAREFLLDGNIALWRTPAPTPLGHTAVPVRVNPAALPERWHTGQSTEGVAYTLRRQAPFRALRTPVTW